MTLPFPRWGRPAALALCACTAASAQDPRPNVLFISVDDLNTAVGFLSEEAGNPLQMLYPDPVVRAQVRAVLTPNLDRLAAEGVPFANAHANAPLCAPSRASLLTGVSPHVSGFYSNGDDIRSNDVLADLQTLPEFFKGAGYYTAGMGKVFHEARVALNAAGEIEEDGPDVQRSWVQWLNRNVGTAGPKTFSQWSPPTGYLQFGTTPRSLERQPDFENADVVARLLLNGSVVAEDDSYDEDVELRLDPGVPFFLALGLYRPHLPLIVPDELLDLFDLTDLDLTEEGWNASLSDTGDLPEGGLSILNVEDGEVTAGRTWELLEQARAVDPDSGTVAAWKELVRHYLAGVVMADRSVGRVLDALDASPYAENTIVVLWGDHGWHLGEKTFFEKHALWQDATQTPLIIRPAGVTSAPGVLRQQGVSLLDVYPTLAGLTGLPAPPHLEGRDLSALLVDPASPDDEAVLSSFGKKNQAIRTADFRYIRYDSNPANAELYDIVADPDERTNLWGDPAYESTRQAMDDALERALRVIPADGVLVEGEAGYRLLAPGGSGLTVADLAALNLVSGLPDQYPEGPVTLYTGFDGSAWVPATSMDEPLEPGRGFFWYLYNETFSLEEAGEGLGGSHALPFVLVSDAPVTESVSVSLSTAGARFNALGNPFGERLDLTDLGSWPGGEHITRRAYVWDAESGSWVTGREAGPWQGFLVRAKKQRDGETLTIPTPTGAARAGSAVAHEPAISFDLAGTDAASGRALRDLSLRVAFAADARSGLDDFDLPKLVSLAPAYVGLGALVDGALLSEDARPHAPASFEVPLGLEAVGAEQALTLRWELDGLPPHWQIGLRDTETGRSVDLRRESSYAFEAGSAARQALASPSVREADPSAAAVRFVLSVETGRDEDAPLALALLPVSPNPAGRRTRVSFDLPEAGPARVSVMDVRGREVAVLADGSTAAGRHVIAWEVSGLASGVYVVRLETGGEVLSRRLAVLR